jgi:L-lactate dehydrogenase complex protein LldF
MRAVGRTFASRKAYERAQRLAQAGRGPLAGLAAHAPGLAGWTTMRELPEVPRQTFREWWRSRPRDSEAGGE